MLEQMIKNMSPDLIVQAIQSNPTVVPKIPHKFEAFVALGQALTPEQQVYISGNINKLAEFFRDKEVKEALGILADAFAKKTQEPVLAPTKVAAKTAPIK